MRPLITPPPSLRCTRCNGELRLKQIERAERSPGFQHQTFVCGTCGHERGCLSGRDRYEAVAHVGGHRGRISSTPLS